MKKSFLKTGILETIQTVDNETGEVLDISHKKHTYIANSKEEFFLVYSSLIGLFQKISAAEVRVYAYLLENYFTKSMIVINDIVRQDMVTKTGLASGSINNALALLASSSNKDHPLLYRIGRGTYQLNPRYAFRGSSLDRNNSLKALIELGCKDC